MRTHPILIVDDDDLCCRMTAAVLERAGYSAQWTTSPIGALEMVQRHPYALVVSDVNMPCLNGVALAAELARTHPDLGVVLVTAFPDRRLATEAEALGVRLLIKPIPVEVLIATVDELTAEPVVARTAT